MKDVSSYFKQSIAGKIFGLAAFLIGLNILLIAFLLFESTRLSSAMNAVVQFYMPLGDSVSVVNESGLRRRLAFERWFGALNAAQPNAEVITDAQQNYARFDQSLLAAIQRSKSILEMHDAYLRGQHEATEINLLLAQVEREYPTISKRQREVLDMQRLGDHAQANRLLNLLNDEQAILQDQRNSLNRLLDALVKRSAEDVVQRQDQVFWIAVAATISIVLLGVVIAYIISLRLTRPVRSLAHAMRDVQGGNTDLVLKVVSNDELGSLTASFNFFVEELRNKERIKRMFGKYVDPRILSKVLDDNGTTGMAGERRVMTVAFADLVGFTSLSERLTPSAMSNLLNRHFSLQAQAVHTCSGVVDKFIGDAVMAFWGAPFVSEVDHARLACHSALQQIAALDTLRTELADITGLRKDVPAIDVRIGLCTGDLFAGTIGAENARSFTVIGDTVNLASRIEGANRLYGTRILISDTTRQTIGSEFLVREIDAIAVKGKSEPVKVYELLGLSEQATALQLQLCDDYHTALEAYRRQDWDIAEASLHQCLERHPQDGAAQLLLKRIEHLRVQPPGTAWDGVWHLDTK